MDVGRSFGGDFLVKSCSKNCYTGDGIGNVEQENTAVATVSSQELLEHFKMLYCRREAG